ncbi:HNH endonuclease [Archangium violaceum]|uniref:HNH endonuclease n=1 Tax=Archangium violaceum TaxID=83451 RepID=UPI0036D92354
MEMGLSVELVRRLARNPFMRVDEARVRTRAFFLWENRTGSAWWDPQQNWMEAELLEVLNYAQVVLRAVSCRQNLVAAPPLDFERNYEVLADLKHWHHQWDGQKEKVGTRAPRRCALCGRDSAQATFRREAHLILEAFGNKSIITHDECDDCNTRQMARLDNELAALLGVERAVAAVRPKKGRTAKAQLDSARSSIGGQEAGAPLEVVLREGDSSVSVTFGSGNTLNLAGPRLTFRPLSAIRSLARMGFQALPAEQRQRFENVRRLVMGEVEVAPARLYKIFRPGDPFAFVGLTVWTRTSERTELPEMLVALTLGNHILFWASPNFSDSRYRDPMLPMLPRGGDSRNPLSLQVLTFASDAPTKYPAPPVYEFQYAGRLLVYLKEPLEAWLEVALAGEEPVRLACELSTPEMIKPMGSGAAISYLLSGGELVFELRVESLPEFARISLQEKLGGLRPAEVARALKVLAAIQTGAQVRVLEQATGEELLRFDNPEGDSSEEFWRARLEWVKTAEWLEGVLGIELRWPEQWTLEDQRVLEGSRVMREAGRILMSSPGALSIPIQASGARDSLRQIQAHPEGMTVRWREGREQLFGQELDVGPEDLLLEEPRLLKPADELIAQADAALARGESEVEVHLQAERIWLVYPRLQALGACRSNPP